MAAPRRQTLSALGPAVFAALGQFRTVNLQGLFSGVQALVGAVGRGCSEVLDFDGLDGAAFDLGDAGGIDAVIDDVGVLLAFVSGLNHGVVVDDRGLVVNGPDLLLFVEVLARPFAYLPKVTEVEVVPIQAEVEAHIDVLPAEQEIPGHGVVMRGGRQWRPAAVVAACAPSDPGRSPHPIGKPNPAVMRMEMPAAVVENRPAPGIIGGPIPAMIGIDPVSLVPVRTPAWIADNHRGL